MRYGSVCSGIEAATCAWHPLGWEADWFAEIEKFPSAVLAHHYPDVPNLGDMTKIAAMIRAGTVSAPDVLVGGTPCQAFSIAGLRGSMEDARGQLTLAFVKLADTIDESRLVRGKPPAIVVWENVPGVLSTADNAFGCILDPLGAGGCRHTAGPEADATFGLSGQVRPAGVVQGVRGAPRYLIVTRFPAIRQPRHAGAYGWLRRPRRGRPPFLAPPRRRPRDPLHAPAE